MMDSVHTHPQDVVSPAKKVSEKVRARLSKKVMNTDGTVKPFSEIPVSTRTAIVVTNLFIDLNKLFDYCPIAEFEPVMKRRGRKKRVNIERPTAILPFGSVVNVQYECKVRGTLLKPKKQVEEEDEEQSASKAYFLHCVTLVIAINKEENVFGENCTKNVKVYCNGKLQITGCKTDQQYLDTMEAIFKLFQDIKTYTGEEVILNQATLETYTAVFNTVMQNINWYMGFGICRDKLDRIINTYYREQYCSIYEASVTPSLNIKIPIQVSNETPLLSMTFNKETQEVSQSMVPYGDYKTFFAKKNKQREAYHTFLVFATGNIIFTSSAANRKDVFEEIISILVKYKDEIKEDTQSK
jgi:TATA-box binding protein (TBP) (component of TFIID and TFIIIB)